jgi:hypothetical protein
MALKSKRARRWLRQYMRNAYLMVIPPTSPQTARHLSVFLVCVVLDPQVFWSGDSP